MAGMERFTQKARRVLSFAHQQAERAHHNTIGPEHLLLGLMEEEGGVAGRVLRELGMTVDGMREVVFRVSSASPDFDPNRVELGTQTQQVLENAVDEARRLGHHYIGTEHILLGLLRVDSTALKVLQELGTDAEQIRRQTRRVLNESASRPVVQAGPAQIYTWYGSNTELRDTVTKFIEKIGFKSVFLEDETSNAATVSQRLDRMISGIRFAIILVSSDDLGFGQDHIMDEALISGQNSIYQSGYFHAKLGANRVCILCEENLHSKARMLFDALGIGYLVVDQSREWMLKLVSKMVLAGLNVDFGKIA
ncbi:MAG TPA: Clp protease N-terminal domain-containing protein [Anaerolineales bacterium]|nr:Clp protease N-terminal domain-containing protein [Anaerolineales bacterium]HLO31836.1 Clp protease N-terminal domain-containing protein [Anaerolineales bacterium]